MKWAKHEVEKCIKYFCSNVRGREHLRWKDNSEMDLEIAYDYANQIKLSQHMV
jgi:hypothetical protein